MFDPKLRFDHALKGLDNPLGLRQVRRDVARLPRAEDRQVTSTHDIVHTQIEIFVQGPVRNVLLI